MPRESLAYRPEIYQLPEKAFPFFLKQKGQPCWLPLLGVTLARMVYLSSTIFLVSLSAPVVRV
jgi:hypothetical protein